MGMTHRVLALNILILWISVGCVAGLDSDLNTNVNEATDTSKSDPTLRDQESLFVLNLEASCENPCSMSVNAKSNITRVIYYADQWLLGESTDHENNFSISYTFEMLGPRKLSATGYNDANDELGKDAKDVDITSAEVSANGMIPNVPYFFQYNNQLHPSASCQNTSIAMILAYFGWTGTPDDITYAYGKDYAQSPNQLAEVFNDYASRNRFPKRLVPNTSGTLSGLRAELDQGRPVITHGFFTGYGHVLVVLGYDANGYYVNDPAGSWSQVFKGGYPGSSSTAGKKIYYEKDAFERAVATYDGYSFTTLWYHFLR
jgi:uncharacterized protein YvpB